MSKVDTIHPILILKEHNWVYSVAFSPDGNYIAYNDSYRIILRNFQSGQIKGYDKLNYDDDTVYSIAFSPDGTQIVSGNMRDKVCIWDVESKKKIATLKLHTDYVSNTYVYSVAFSPDGKYIVCGSDDNTVRLWDVESREQIATLRGHASVVWSVAFSPDGTQIVSGSDDNKICLWDVEKYTYNPDHVEQDKHMNTLGSQLPLDMNVEFMKYLNKKDQYKLKKEAKKSKISDTRVRNMKKLNLNIDEYRDMVAYLLRSSFGASNEQLLQEWVSTERSRLRKTKKKGKERSVEKSKSSGKKSSKARS